MQDPCEDEDGSRAEPDECCCCGVFKIQGVWWLTLLPHSKKLMGSTLVCLSVLSLHAFPFCVASNLVLWLPPTFQMHAFCIGPVRDCLLPPEADGIGSSVPELDRRKDKRVTFSDSETA